MKYKFISLILMSLPCLSMEQFRFEQLPAEIQRIITVELVKKVISQPNMLRSYDEYKTLTLEELNSYKSVSKKMKSLISDVLKNNKNEFKKIISNLKFVSFLLTTDIPTITGKAHFAEKLSGELSFKSKRKN